MELRAEAERYCDLIEDTQSLKSAAFMSDVTGALADVLAAGQRLPELSPTSEDVLDPRPTDVEASSRFAAVNEILGGAASYWTTLEPYGEEGSEAVVASLADDLTDIWRDLKAGLVALEEGVAPNEVLWDWRFGYYTHWGRHAVEALRALHAQLAETHGRTNGAD